jgi:hypothetical protein
MASEKVRQQMCFMAAIASLGMGALITFHLIAMRVMGITILVNNQEFEGFLTGVAQHKHLYAASGIVEALSVACLIPMALAFVAVFEEDRAYAILAAAFLLVGGVLLVDAYAHYGNMVGLAEDLQLGRAPTDLVVKLADTQGDLFEIIQYGGLCGAGAGLVIVSILMARCEYFSRPVSWITFATGMVAFIYTVVPAAFDFAQPAWAFVLGGYWLLKEARVTSPEEEPEIA